MVRKKKEDIKNIREKKKKTFQWTIMSFRYFLLYFIALYERNDSQPTNQRWNDENDVKNDNQICQQTKFNTNKYLSTSLCYFSLHFIQKRSRSNLKGWMGKIENGKACERNQLKTDHYELFINYYFKSLIMPIENL